MISKKIEKIHEMNGDIQKICREEKIACISIFIDDESVSSAVEGSGEAIANGLLNVCNEDEEFGNVIKAVAAKLAIDSMSNEQKEKINEVIEDLKNKFKK